LPHPARGLATAAAKAGKSERSIMKQTGHRSVTVVRRYIRDAEFWHAGDRRIDKPYIPLYIHAVAQRAKLFQNGGSQAVRLPQSCRFPEDATEVVVRREGNRIILEPVDAWPDDFRDLVGAWTEDIPRSPPAKTPKRDPFK
jgi:virulence-associated protein VagC